MRILRQRFVVGVNLFLWVMYRRWCWYLWQLRWFVKLVSEATRQLDEENSKLSTPFKMSSKGGELISKKKSGWTKRRNSRMTFKMTVKMTLLKWLSKNLLNVMFVYRNTYVASSVMSLGYFWKILATNFHAKVFQVFGNFVSFRKNISFKK